MKVEKDFIRLISAAVNQESVPDKICDWGKILELAKAHDVAGLICYALDSMERKPHNYKEFCNLRNFLLMKSINQSYEAATLFHVLDTNKIEYVALKGVELKKLYPSSDMRSMSDIDILIKEKDYEKVSERMLKLGYYIKKQKAEEIEFWKKPYMVVEVATTMLAEVQSGMEWYFKDYWQKLKKSETYRYRQTDEDYFIYHFVHLSKHYSMYGTGVRPFIDIYVYLKNKKDTLDWTYIEDELNKLKLWEFSKNAIRLSEYLFGSGDKDDILEEMEEYVLSNSLFGTMENKISTRVIENGKVVGLKRLKLKRYFFAIFPSLRTMKNLYPDLKKYPVLLPFYWVRRIISRVFFKQKRIKNFVNIYRNVNYENAIAHNEHMKRVGL